MHVGGQFAVVGGLAVALFEAVGKEPLVGMQTSHGFEDRTWQAECSQANRMQSGTVQDTKDLFEKGAVTRFKIGAVHQRDRSSGASSGPQELTTKWQ